jgi:hypothetical protein
MDLINLTKLTALTIGSSNIKIGLIDGPIALDHKDLLGMKLQEISKKSAACALTKSTACAHGTFVAGVLAGKRNSFAPAICPGCSFVVRPIFTEGLEMPSASPEDLAEAIVESVDAGAQVINLSLGLTKQSKGKNELQASLDYSVKKGTIVVAAAGNQGSIGSSVLTSHPWVVSVAACDFNGKPMDQSNFGFSMSKWGLMAPSENIQSLKSDGGYTTMSGTSVAAPFVTGVTGLLWSLFPEASPDLIRSALVQNGRRRRSLIPPLLDAWGSYQFLLNSSSSSGSFPERGKIMEQNEQKEEKTVEIVRPSAAISTPEQDLGAAAMQQICGTCQKSLEQAASNEVSKRTYIYALGRIEPKFPSISIEKEFDQAGGRVDAKGLTNRQTMHSVLSKKENRYLARRICWVMTIEGLETYILKPRDPGDLDLLLEAVRSEPNRNDVDIVIGIKGPIAPPQLCNGLQVPIVFFDQIYSFDVESLIKSVPRPEKKAAKDFEPAATELFERIMQMADNAGATDENRALNYLAVRYPAIYATAAQQFDKNCSMNGIEVLPSRLSGVRKVLDVVFAFTNRSTDVDDKFFVRVDVTDEFPFLVTKMSPYYDR